MALPSECAQLLTAPAARHIGAAIIVHMRRRRLHGAGVPAVEDGHEAAAFDFDGSGLMASRRMLAAAEAKHGRRRSHRKQPSAAISSWDYRCTSQQYRRRGQALAGRLMLRAAQAGEDTCACRR